MKRRGTKVLSLLLAALMAFSSFVLISGVFGGDLLGTKQTAKAADLSTVVIGVPETIYMTPQNNYGTTTTSVKYYVNNVVSSSGGYSLDATNNATAGKFYVYSPQISSINSISVNGASLSNLSASKSGSLFSDTSFTMTLSSGISSSQTKLLEWTIKVTDTAGEKHALHAYTVAYNPYLSPVFAAGRCKNTRGSNSFGSGLSWVSGIHGISTGGGYYPYNNFLPIYDSSHPSQGGGTSNPDGWFNSNQQCGLPTQGGWYTSKEYGYNYGDETLCVFERSAEAYINVDTSRYSNLNQIPNLNGGIYVTDNEGAGTVWGYWGKLNNWGDRIQSGRNWYTRKTTNPSEYDASVDIYGGDRWTNRGRNWAIRGCTMNSSIPSGWVAFRGGFGTDGSGDRCFCILDSYVNFIQVNKANLRNLIKDCYKYTSTIYPGETYDNFISAFRTAATVLGNPTSTDVTNAYNTLNSAKNTLKKAAALTLNTQVTVNHTDSYALYYTFTPSESGKYVFFTYDTDNTPDPYLYLYTPDISVMNGVSTSAFKSNDDIGDAKIRELLSGSQNNFGSWQSYIKDAELTAGTKYLVKAYDRGNTGTYPMKVCKAVDITFNATGGATTFTKTLPAGHTLHMDQSGLTRGNHELIAWSTNGQGNEAKTCMASDTITIPSSDTTYYALWYPTNPATLTVNSSNTATINAPSEIQYYAFTPTETRNYLIYSTSTATALDPFVLIYNNDTYHTQGTYLTYDDDGGNSHHDFVGSANRNFFYETELTAGTKYLFGVKAYHNTTASNNLPTGSYPFRFEAVYKVKYHDSWGTGDSENGTLLTEQKKYCGKTQTLSSAVPEYAGYTFVGWSTSPNDTTAEYQPGGTVAANLNADLDLYAVYSNTQKAVFHYYIENPEDGNKVNLINQPAQNSTFYLYYNLSAANKPATYADVTVPAGVSNAKSGDIDFAFLGWTTDPASHVTDSAITGGSHLTLDVEDMPTGKDCYTHHFYAVYSAAVTADWHYYSDSSQTVSEDLNHGEDTAYNTANETNLTATVDDKQFTPPANVPQTQTLPDGNVYTFRGWARNADHASSADAPVLDTAADVGKVYPATNAHQHFYAVYGRDLTANWNYYINGSISSGTNAAKTLTAYLVTGNDNTEAKSGELAFTFPQPANVTGASTDGRAFTYLGWREDTEKTEPELTGVTTKKLPLNDADQTFTYYAVYSSDVIATYDLNSPDATRVTTTNVPLNNSSATQYMSAVTNDASDENNRTAVDLPINPDAVVLTRTGMEAFLGWNHYGTDPESETETFATTASESTKVNQKYIAVFKDLRYEVKIVDYNDSPIYTTQQVRHHYNYTNDATNGSLTASYSFARPDETNNHPNATYHYVYDQLRLLEGSEDSFTGTENGYTLKNILGKTTVTATYKGEPHQWEEDYVISRPRCDKEGYTHRHCTVCGWGADDPVVTEANVEEYIAKGTVEVTTDPAGHDFKLYDQKAATCTSTGTAGRLLCAKCFNYVKCANGHVTALADVADGKCPTCGEVINPVTPYKGADYEAHPNTEGKHYFVDSGETAADGAKIYRCAYCGREQLVYESASGLTLTAVPSENATCLKAGRKSYFVDAETGDKYYDQNGSQKVTDENDLVIPKKAHTFRDPLESAVAVTCTSKGYAAGAKVCSMCGYTESFAAYYVTLNEGDQPTNEGFEAFVGAADPELGYAVDTFLPEGHLLGSEQYHAAVAATCVEEGNVAYFTCGRCGKNLQPIEQTVNIEGTEITLTSYKELLDGEWIVNATGHNFPEGTTRTYRVASCTEDGGWVYSAACINEGCELGTFEKTADKLGHNLQKVEAKAATCTEAGNKEYYACTRCDLKTWSDDEADAVGADETVVIPATGHDAAPAHTAANEATCTAEGNKEYYTCGKCGKTFADATCAEELTDVVIPKKDHDCTETKTKGADCRTRGDLIRECKNCDFTETIAGRGDKGDHTWISKTNPATCTNSGEAWEECSVCGTKKSGSKQILDALGHNMGDWKDIGDNKEERHCTRCDYTETRTKDSGAGDNGDNGGNTPETPASTNERCAKCGMVHANRTGIFAENGLLCKIVSFFRRIFSVFKK